MLLNQITHRQATQADWPAIADLLDANKLPLDGAQAHLSTYVVAVRGKEIVGCAGAEIYGPVALMRSVAVRPGLHKEGIGKSLVGLVLAEARRRGIQSIHLLSVTAPEYFFQFGFKRGPREQAPQGVQASAEFQGACPSCAAFMSLQLQAAPAPMPSDLPVAVIGAGPVGLAAAARLIEQGIAPLILEAGESVGASLSDFGHVRLFSPWCYNIDKAMAAMLAPTRWEAPPPDELPLAREVVDQVLQPFAKLPQVAQGLKLNTRVQSISREGFDKVKTFGREGAPFVIHALHNGQPIQFKARAVIDASGTWRTPNPLGANGVEVNGEAEMADVIRYGIPDVLGHDRNRYAGRRTLVVGDGHSAANALLSLGELAATTPKTSLVWAVRSTQTPRAFGGGQGDALAARGKLGSDLQALQASGKLTFHGGFKIASVSREDGALAVQGFDALGQSITLRGIDQIICATGQRPDLTLTRELRLELDPWLESTQALGPLIDPNVHSCGTVRPHGHRELSHPETGFYTVGVKSYGRAPTFLMLTGFEQVRSVVAAIAGDITAADRVELELPETGVCSLSSAPGQVQPQASTPQAAQGCCDPTPSPSAQPSSCGTGSASSCSPQAQPTAVEASGCGSTKGCGTSPVQAAINAVRRKVACCG